MGCLGNLQDGIFRPQFSPEKPALGAAVIGMRFAGLFVAQHRP